MLKRTDFAELSTYFLAHEAQKRNYSVEKLYKDTSRSHLIIENGNEIAIIMGQRLPSLSFDAYFTCKNKEIAKRLLIRKGVSTPQGGFFSKKEKAFEFFTQIKKPVVIKPSNGVWGTAVHMDVDSEDIANKAIDVIIDRGSPILIEEQITGKEYRILATKDKLLGIIHRVPANIIGDKEHTIQELIDLKNEDPRRGSGHEKALVKIQIDDEVHRILKKSGYTLNSIPSEGEKVFLRQNSNLCTGGDSIDFTDKAHPAYKELAPEIIRAIPGLPYAGFDLMTPDITKDPKDVGYSVIELNDSPMLSMHHEPYEGKGSNVSKEIIDMLFE